MGHAPRACSGQGLVRAKGLFAGAFPLQDGAEQCTDGGRAAARAGKRTMDEFDELLTGYGTFRDTTYEENRRLYRDLAEHGQDPKVMVVACCDSRVDPTTVFNAPPGSLFVVRNVANLVPPYEPHGDYHGTSAALEFAVTGLGVRSIVVLGHASCGGVRAFLDGAYDRAASGRFIAKWMSIMKAALSIALTEGRSRDAESTQRVLEQAAIGISLENLETFPFVKERLEDGTLSLHGAYFDIGTGTLYRYRADEKSFVPVDESGERAEAPAQG